MSDVLDKLVKQLTLEPIEKNLFRGESQDLGWGTVYGGQVLGQALSAAVQTVPAERQVHSLHAHFLRPGDVKHPIIYDVDRIRDGGSFTTRRVVAIQHGEAILHLSASFQVDEPGFEHQEEMPQVPGPGDLESESVKWQQAAKNLPAFVQKIAAVKRPFDSRPVELDMNLTAPTARPPRRAVWLKMLGTLPDTPSLHRALLAYASDHALITTALLPHGVSWLTPGMHVASLDHAMWFHAPFRADDWLLHVMESPRASGARGLSRGSIFSKDGRLVASTAQEGLIRQRPIQPNAGP